VSTLRIHGLTKRHAGQAALEGVNLTVEEGEFVALVGPSGSGKTTLLKSINRLSKPDEGSIILDGRDAAGLPLPVLRHGIGYVIQSIGLFPHLTVAENINLVPRLMGTGEDRAAELLALVSLPAEMAVRYPRELSGGQQQRVGVARALAARPKLMLMDEPFGALDPLTRDALGRAYRELHGTLGLTTLMVTHDLGEALLLADRIVVLIDGAIRADAAPAALLDSADAEVRALIEAPLAQARRLAAL
jgi:osmoprotectant transport system ATP-binding protein